jgi:hypothetical protein
MEKPRYNVGDELVVCKECKSLGFKFIVEEIEATDKYDKAVYNSDYWYIYTENGGRARWSEKSIRLLTPLDKLL